MIQSNNSTLWKWVSGLLGSLLLVAVTIAIEDHANLAVINEQQLSQNQIISKLAQNQERVLDIIARMDERLHNLEDGN